MGVSDLQVNPITGHIYVIDHKQYRILRIVSSGPSATVAPTPPPPFIRPSLPLVTSVVFFSAYDIDSVLLIAKKTHYTRPIGRHLPNGGPTGAELVKEVCSRT